MQYNHNKSTEKLDNVYITILAGGSGTRFWPESRHTSPKQLSKIDNSNYTMIEKTLLRLKNFIPPSRRIIVTHKDQIKQTKQIVKNECEHFLAEPEAKNTAAALAYAAIYIEGIKPHNHIEPIMISLHADHIIEDEEAFKQDLLKAIQLAQKDNLTLIGIKPLYPETGYGYIEKGDPINNIDNAYKVSSFKEKPNQTLAKQYVDSHRYCWNCGYFIWKTKIIIQELEKYLPSTIGPLKGLLKEFDTKYILDVPFDALSKAYSTFEKIAIDNAVLEKSSNIAMIESNFGWHDVGSWSSLTQCLPLDKNGNFVNGQSLLIDTYDSVIKTDSYFIATIGLKNFIVVCAKNAILVCPKDKAQDVKRIVETLIEKQKIELI